MAGDLELYVGDFLAHYASQYYDPAKAHEYYLRNRELKGNSQKGMSDQQKQAWAYTKDQIAQARKAAFKGAQEAEQAFLQKARQEAQARGQEISAKLKAAIESLFNKDSGETADALKQLASEQKAKSDQIREKADQAIAALPPIPEGVSDGVRARLTAQRQIQINKIRGDAASELKSVDAETSTKSQKISDDAQAKRQTLSESAQAERDAVRTQLQGTIDKAKADYEAQKQSLKDQFDATSQNELDAIRANLPGGSSGGKKGSSSKKKRGATSPKPGVKSMSLQEAAVESLKRQRTS
jgi:hypothetical protein